MKASIRTACIGVIIVAGATLLLSGCETREAAPRAVPVAAAPAAPVVAADAAPPASQPAGVAEIERPRLSAGPRRIEPRKPTGTFVDRAAPEAVRVMTYNILWNSIFPDVNPENAAKFARIFRAMDPDVIGLQEIGVHPEDRDKSGAQRKSAADVRRLLNEIAPLEGGWHVSEGGSNVIASKYPLLITRGRTEPAAQREVALAYVDLPDAFPHDLYIANTHHKCCGGVQNDPQRQQQSDGIMAWLRDAKSPSGRIELAKGTAFIVLGDFNLVGGPEPLQTILTGNIADEARYGADFSPDWDDTPLTDARPLHNVAGPDEWTWRDDNSQYPPGRLDYIVFSDSVLSLAKAFALDTTTMSEADLKAAGLEKYDVAKDGAGRAFDHVPLAADFVMRRSPREE